MTTSQTPTIYQHRPSIGGSDIGALLGVNRYKTPAQVYDRIVAVLDAQSFEDLPQSIDSNDAERGRELEAACVRKYERETGRQTAYGVVVTHPDYPFMHANVDRLITGGREDDPFASNGTGVLEAKCPRLPNWRTTRDLGVDPSYYAQLQHYLCVTGLGWGSFAFLNAEDWVLHRVDVERDDAMIREIELVCQEFWSVIDRRDRDNAHLTVHDSYTQATQERARLTAESVVRDTHAWRNALQAVLTAKQEAKIAETALDSAKAVLTEMIEQEGVERIAVPGVGRVSYLEQTREGVNYEQLALDHPEIDISRYITRTAYRVLRPTFGRS